MQLYTSKKLKTKHAFTSRFGGVSKAPYNALNLAYHVGDRREDIFTNHQLLAKEMGYDLKKLHFMNQIHSNKVEIITKESFGVPSCDALVTNLRDTPLMVLSADCTPVLFHDPNKAVIAAAHIGRAGAFSNIAENVIWAMQEHFGCKSEDIVVSLGPSIGVCCYEVGQKEQEEADSLGYGFALKDKYLDITAIITHQLLNLKVQEEHIDNLTLCTKCHHDIFFSYRAEAQTGRNGSVIIL
ncbi:COG1496: Uncharacterized conserved protein [hydrothermal vent metagenome]|uniref:COG1496: Uncharacterized conserved protein n=1 Tax=hydrothermal vent metagenome TaxID=652676 RepID=A0A1W1C4I8_9ZZZZ